MPVCFNKFIPLLILAAACSAPAQPCEPHWSDQYPPGKGADSAFTAAALDIDGPGPLPSRLYIGAQSIGQIEFGGVGCFDGVKWAAVGDTGGWTLKLLVFDDGAGEGPALYAGGGFYFGEEGVFPTVARWDGQVWSPLGGGPYFYEVSDLAPYDPDGDGPEPATLAEVGWGDILDYLIAYWNGSTWVAFPDTEPNWGVLPSASDLAEFDRDGDGPAPMSLFMSGWFPTLNGEPFGSIARWEAGQWHQVGGGANTSLSDLAVFDEDGPGPGLPALFATGGFTQIGGQSIRGVARWDGAAWSQVGPGLIAGDADYAEVLDPDGPGPIAPGLYIAGDFTLADGALSSLARWDGNAWQSVTRLDDGSINGAAFYDADGAGPEAPSLYIVGDFVSVEGVPSVNIAVLECAVAVCYPDLDADGALTLFDFLAFVNLFNAADPAADCDASGDLDLFDFLCFTNAFNAGC